MKYTKMHGLGNNYIYVNEFEVKLQEAELALIAVKVSDVNFGIGSDGMILIGPSRVADFRMRIFNSDGSEAKNCGNGLRCVAKYVYDRSMTHERHFTIETLGGIVHVEVHVDEEAVQTVSIDMGKPRLMKKEIPMLGDEDSITINESVQIDGADYQMTVVSMGNPHSVMFVEDIEQAAVNQIGPTVEHAALFPERINVEFVQVQNSHEIDFRVWERGSGITMACGTGACAAVVAGVLGGHLERAKPITVHLLGGDLVITYADNDHVYMKGPATFISDGVFYLR
ncbi:diaminopimelate epimerase [Paenibacillus albiflavus]|uniref:Diaminopimelate epimerase n=1 Tax=Paenibacillus albiflavus TaxID=2545760 RepID=A0A4R4EFU8_9BACL|nr:diaminopimelate epimerase [Paenibacillus albiflavus]TCZ77111.1 diaminopimelate epimerase [Paenibacillus albiflavus]